MKKYIAGLLGILVSCQPDSQDSSVLLTEPEVIEVTEVPIIESQEAGELELTGLLFAQNEVKLSFKTGGIIQKIYADEGQKIKEGQTLAVLKSDEIDAQVKQTLLAQEKAKRDFDRASSLLLDSAITLEQYQNAKTALDVAVETQRQAEFNRDYSIIKAPFSGTVLKKVANDGEITAPGLPILILTKTGSKNSWYLKTGVTDRQWGDIQTGDPAEIYFESFPGQIFEGIVIQKLPSSDPGTGLLQIEISVNFKANQPAIGMFGKATINPKFSTNKRRIPLDALLDADGSKGFVFVSTPEKLARKMEIEILEIDRNGVWIGKGLESYSTIILPESPFLRENSKISIR